MSHPRWVVPSPMSAEVPPGQYSVVIPDLYDDLLGRLFQNRIYLPAPRSHSADVIIRLSWDLYLLLQMKCTKSVTPADVKKEVAKHFGPKRAILLFFCLEIGGNLLGQAAVRANRGTHAYVFYPGTVINVKVRLVCALILTLQCTQSKPPTPLNSSIARLPCRCRTTSP